MTRSPILWGAGLACALGGAVAGSALGSTPMLDRSTIASLYTVHDTAYGHKAAADAPPDQYPLVTREGTVPVAELGTRGLYSQARYRAYAYAMNRLSAETETAEWQPDAQFAHYESSDEGPRGGDAEIPVEAGHDEQVRSEPLELAAGPATVTAPGHAKLIDVQATLAMR